jgi:hypothetical protein
VPDSDQEVGNFAQGRKDIQADINMMLSRAALLQAGDLASEIVSLESRRKNMLLHHQKKALVVQRLVDTFKKPTEEVETGSQSATARVTPASNDRLDDFLAVVEELRRGNTEYFTYCLLHLESRHRLLRGIKPNYLEELEYSVAKEKLLLVQLATLGQLRCSAILEKLQNGDTSYTRNPSLAKGTEQCRAELRGVSIETKRVVAEFQDSKMLEADLPILQRSFSALARDDFFEASKSNVYILLNNNTEAEIADLFQSLIVIQGIYTDADNLAQAKKEVIKTIQAIRYEAGLA